MYRQKLQRWKIYGGATIGLVLVLGLLLINKPDIFKCPDDYATAEESAVAFGQWLDNFYGHNPDASLSDMADTRRAFYEQNDCVDVLKRMDDYDAGRANPVTLELIDQAIREAVGPVSP